MATATTVAPGWGHHGGEQGAPARERSGVSGAPRATEPGFGAEPR